MTPRDIEYMNAALAAARTAAGLGEVPVGAVVVSGDVIVGLGYNRREILQSPIAHAEIMALQAAALRLGSWRLNECDLYVTLEPCAMCAGAMLQGRVRRLVYGCKDPKAGAVESLYRLCEDQRLNHQIPVEGGVLAEECAALLGEFFARLRQQKQELAKTERWPSPVEGA